MILEKDLRALYERVLAPRLLALEEDRKSMARGYWGTGLAAIAGLLALRAFFGIFGSRSPELGALLTAAFVGAAVFFYRHFNVGGSASFGSYRDRFKREIVSEVFRAVCPGAIYEPRAGLRREDFAASGLFTSSVDRYQSDDRVRGRIGDTEFELADVQATFTRGLGKRKKLYPVMQGLYLRLDFNKHLRARTLVFPQDAPSWRMGERNGVDLVRLENPDFEALYAVYGSDPVEARYVLTPLLMDRLVELQARTETPPHLAFFGIHVHAAFHYGRSLFEPSYFFTESFETVQKIAEDVGLAEFLVRELDLNTRIWTKS